MDEEYINKKFINELEDKYDNVRIIFSQTSIDKKIGMLQNASKFYVHCSKTTEDIWKYIWAMKPKAQLIDIQNEMELNGEIHHLANACGLDHILHIVPKGILSSFYRNKIIYGEKEDAENLPVIQMPEPKMNGFFGHKGDSFRELVDLWVERGYVKKEYGSSDNVWFNGVGNILLYDRPNYDWIKNSRKEEQSIIW
jgi:hypothetical protein